MVNFSLKTTQPKSLPKSKQATNITDLRAQHSASAFLFGSGSGGREAQANLSGVIGAELVRFDFATTSHPKQVSIPIVTNLSNNNNTSRDSWLKCFIFRIIKIVPDNLGRRKWAAPRAERIRGTNQLRSEDAPIFSGFVCTSFSGCLW